MLSDGENKDNPHGVKSHCPRGMAAARFAGGTEADPEEQYKDAPGEDTEDSQDWLDLEKKPQKGKVKQVQVSPRVRQVTNSSRLKEEQKNLPKKSLQHHNPPT